MLPTPRLRLDALSISLRRMVSGAFWLFSRAFPLVLPGLAAIGFGGVLLLPYDTFSTGTSFVGMRELASEEAWGKIIVGVGFLHLMILATFPRYHPAAAMLLCGLFSAIAAMFFKSTGLASTGTPVYFFLAVQAAWVASARLETHVS